MKVASVSHIRYLVFQAHLCPVRPRVLDSCSLNIRAIHIREAYEPPWARAWFILISWGHKLVWGFIYYPVLMPCFTALFKLCEVLHTVLFRKAECFRGVDKPSHIFGFPVVYSHWRKPWVRLGVSWLHCGSTQWGGPLKYFWILWLLCRDCLVGFWFGFSEAYRVCVAICAPLQGKSFWKSCPRLWTTWSTVSRS